MAGLVGYEASPRGVSSGLYHLQHQLKTRANDLLCQVKGRIFSKRFVLDGELACVGVGRVFRCHLTL